MVSTIAMPSSVQVGEQVQHVVAGVDVDAGRRLVEQQAARAAEQGAGQEHPLLLAAGELADVPLGQLGDAEALEHVAATSARSAALAQGTRRPAVRDISTHSKTVTGKFQFTVSSCGT